MKFKGDIIITDPCYIIKENSDDWSKCGYGDNMTALGIKNYLCRDTIYGDWSCTTFNSDTKEAIGEFCADAGMVAVWAYNPDFDWYTSRPWTTTLIKDFDGDIEMKVIHTEGVYDDDTEWHKKGDKWEDDEVRVIGTGNTNFETHQTGFWEVKTW